MFLLFYITYNRLLQPHYPVTTIVCQNLETHASVFSHSRRRRASQTFQISDPILIDDLLKYGSTIRRISMRPAIAKSPAKRISAIRK